MAGLLVHVVGVTQVGGQQGHLTVVTKHRIGLPELAVDADSFVENEAFTGKMVAAHFFKVFQDASVQLEDLLEALLLHEGPGLLATDASGAEHDHRSGFEPGIHVPHGSGEVAEVVDFGVEGVLKGAQANLVVVANIQKSDGTFFIQPGFEFAGADFRGRAPSRVHPLNAEGNDLFFDFHEHPLKRLGSAPTFLRGQVGHSGNGAKDGEDGVQLGSGPGEEEVDAFGCEENGSLQAEFAATGKKFGFPFFRFLDRGEAVARKIGDGVHGKCHFRPNGRMENRG